MFQFGRKSAATAPVDGDSLLDGHQITPVFTPRRLDRFGGLPKGFVELPFEFVDPSFECQHPLHTRKIETVVCELLYPLEQCDVGIGIAAAAPACARRLDETLALIDPQSLRMNSGKLGRDRDDVNGPIESVLIHDQ